MKQILDNNYNKYYISVKNNFSKYNLGYYDNIIDNEKMIFTNNIFKTINVSDVLKSPTKKICINCGTKNDLLLSNNCNNCSFDICNNCKIESYCENCKIINCKLCLENIWIDYQYLKICLNCKDYLNN